MAKKKVIELKTVADIINHIHMGNKENFLVDFRAWLDIVVNTAQTVRMGIEVAGTDEQKAKYNTTPTSELIGCESMRWIDDGKHNISINVTLAESDKTPTP
jgi:hypothetical protein